MVLTAAYIGCNIVAEVLYVPQLVQAMRDPKGLSPTTWFGWTGTASVSLAYAWFGVHDWPFALMTAVNLIFLAMTSFCIARQRFIPVNRPWWRGLPVKQDAVGSIPTTGAN